MNIKQLLKASFAIALFGTLFLASCTEEEEISPLIGNWEVQTASAAVEFDEEALLSFLLEQGFTQEMSIELMQEFNEGLVEVVDLEEVTTIYEFMDNGNYLIRSSFQNGGFPDEEEAGTYSIDPENNTLTFTPMVGAENDSFTFTIETLSETDLILSMVIEEDINYGINGSNILIAYTINLSIELSRI